jgi:hypothetical protein
MREYNVVLKGGLPHCYLYMLSSIRRAHRVKLPAVRKAVDYLRKRFDSDHPLLDRQMLTGAKDLFIKRYDHLVTISQDGQMAMSEIMVAYLKHIVWDERGVAIRLFPFTRESYERSA